MKISREVIRKIEFILLIIFIFFSIIASGGYGEFGIIRNIILFIQISLMGLYKIFTKNSIKIPLSTQSILWYILANIVTLSIIYNSNNLMNIVLYLFLIPIFYFVLLPDIFNESLIKVMIKALIISYSFIIVYSLIKYPIIEGYKGIFYNSNTMGHVTFTLSIILLCVIMDEKNNLKLKIPLSIFLILNIIIIFMTGSRTSLISFFIIFLILNIEYIKRHFLLGLISMVIIYFSVTNILKKFPILTEYLTAKFNNANSIDGLTSGRFDYWKTIFNERSLLGHGEGYFIGAHNSYIQVLSNYGIIACILLILFSIYMIYKSYIYYINTKNNNIRTIFVINISFCMISMTEGIYSLLGTGLVIAWFISNGYLIYILSNKKIIIGRNL